MAVAWKILIALTLARLSMGMQFQAIPALGTPLMAAQDLSFVAIGTLTGAYLLPGVAAALGSGWLGQTLGDSRTALWGLALMAAGGFGGWMADSYGAALFWRVLAGCGAVGLNVMLTKMAADWFQGRSDLPTAMGVLVSSWPAGIALAMFVLPPIEAAFGLSVALLMPALLCAGVLVMLLAVLRPKARQAGAALAGASLWFTRQELVMVGLAGCIWGVYNVAFIASITWMPGQLKAHGATPVVAAQAASLIGWAAILSVAAGGWLAARAPWRDLPALCCFALTGALLIAVPMMGAQAGSVWIMVGFGLLLGPAAAVIMTLPVEAARPEIRALAMGYYFAIYYALMGIAPTLIGALRDMSGTASAPLYLAALLMGVCILLWTVFRGLQRRAQD